MNKKDLATAHCRIYRGEEVCPIKTVSRERTLWFWEKNWVEHTLDAQKDEDSNGMKVLSLYFNEYMASGLTEFRNMDGVPVSLKALLFNRYCDVGDHIDPKGFKQWYETEYLTIKKASV